MSLDENIEISPPKAYNPEDTPSILPPAEDENQILDDPGLDNEPENTGPETNEYEKAELVGDEADNNHKYSLLTETEISPPIAPHQEYTTAPSIQLPNENENQISKNPYLDNEPENTNTEMNDLEIEGENKDELGKQEVDENDKEINRESVEESFDDLAFQQALEKLRNFKPKRPVQPTQQFPDLSVEGETMARPRDDHAGGSPHCVGPIAFFEVSCPPVALTLL